MRRARIKVNSELEPGVYHLISRTVNGEWMFGTTAKEILRRQMWQVADFAGVEILTYAIMSNHFHLLVQVPQRPELSDAELLRRYAVLYPKPTKHQVARLEVIRAGLAANTPAAEAWRKRQRALMYDVSQYMKLLKERFSIWYNARHRRFGPVWADRFKSQLLEGKERVVQTVAAYIDLNCVRAGISKDPKDYRFCGYAEAVSGHVPARQGLQAVVGGNWEQAQCSYRLLLFTSGGAAREGRASLPVKQVRAAVEAGGKLSLPDVLRCRIRYFSEGVVLGGREFVDEHVAAYRTKHSLTHRVKRHDLPDPGWGEIAGLRPLRGALLS
ncbi:transposase [Opitutus sp. ER46]|uniref:transposase n=1 Tax=Opitutus sp. ER46 TaxID=2161864 RepID=UPI000D2F8271|nr:transposase [Opitutus sp. ER46]PTX94435.1 transposase [Opitutus sp. ER46]